MYPLYASAFYFNVITPVLRSSLTTTTPLTSDPMPVARISSFRWNMSQAWIKILQSMKCLNLHNTPINVCTYRWIILGNPPSYTRVIDKFWALGGPLGGPCRAKLRRNLAKQTFGFSLERCFDPCGGPNVRNPTFCWPFTSLPTPFQNGNEPFLQHYNEDGKFYNQ